MSAQPKIVQCTGARARRLVCAGEQRYTCGTVRVLPQHQPTFRELGIDADAVFAHELIVPWRLLADRENCTLDARLHDGRHVRWHIKRYAPARGQRSPADAEVTGHRLLVERGVPTVDLIAWGALTDGRSFVILNDLNGYDAADKLIERRQATFDQLIEPAAHLAAKLHSAGLHHRDLYLCHFFARVSGADVDVRLIDTARVRPLPKFLGARWVIKDLAQFWYSTLDLPVTDAERRRWLATYAQARSIDDAALVPKILRKVKWIARHDRDLRRRQPERNVSIPPSVPPSSRVSPEGSGGHA
jgi:hypothetical protein